MRASLRGASLPDTAVRLSASRVIWIGFVRAGNGPNSIRKTTVFRDMGADLSILTSTRRGDTRERKRIFKRQQRKE